MSRSNLVGLGVGLDVSEETIQGIGHLAGSVVDVVEIPCGCVSVRVVLARNLGIFQQISDCPR